MNTHEYEINTDYVLYPFEQRVNTSHTPHLQVPGTREPGKTTESLTERRPTHVAGGPAKGRRSQSTRRAGGASCLKRSCRTKVLVVITTATRRRTECAIRKSGGDVAPRRSTVRDEKARRRGRSLERVRARGVSTRPPFMQTGGVRW